MQYLLDTNICIFLLRGKYDIPSHIQKVGLSHCHISEITEAELLYGAACSNNAIQNTALVRDFCSSLDIIPISDTIEIYAHQKAQLRKNGTLIDDFDLLIGCCAIKNGMILITDNTKHFSRLPIQLENWIVR